ncbi:MAG: hypothetical protein R6V10_12410 [bacterium]
MKKAPGRKKERSPDQAGPLLAALVLTVYAWLSLFCSVPHESNAKSSSRPGYVCKPASRGFIIRKEEGNNKELSEVCPPRLRFLTGHRFPLETAQKKDLELLPGIGEITAEKILSKRERTEGRLDWKTIPGLTGNARESLEKWVRQEKEGP